MHQINTLQQKNTSWLTERTTAWKLFKSHSQLRQQSFALCFFILFALICVLGGASACSAPPPSTERGVAPRKEYEVAGKVVSVDKTERRVVVDHEEIPGYMDAMRMPFALRDAAYLDLLQPGDDLTATLVVEGGRSYLDNIVFQRQTPMPNAAANATPAVSDAPREPEIGVLVPNARLVNEEGKNFLLADFRNQVVLLTFIYTRCPLPDYCPLMTRNLTEVARLLAEQGVAANQAQLIALSIDPEYDTPQVLRQYETRNVPDATRRARLLFATGAPEEVRRLAHSFGVGFSSAADGSIDHSLRTALIAPDGKLTAIFRGNEWKPEQVAAEVRAALDRATASPREGE